LWYDSHITSLERFESRNNICVPKTDEEYILFSKQIKMGDNSWDQLEIFMDTYRFMASSLDKLSSNLLKTGINKFK